MSYQFYKVLHMLGFMLFIFWIRRTSCRRLRQSTITKKCAYHDLCGSWLRLAFNFSEWFPVWPHAWVLCRVCQLGCRLKSASGFFWESQSLLVKRKGSIGWPVAILLWGLGTTAAFIVSTNHFRGAVKKASCEAFLLHDFFEFLFKICSHLLKSILQQQI